MDHRGFVSLVIDAFQNLAEPATVCVGRAHLQQSPAAQLLAGLAGCLGAIFTLEVGLIIGAALRRFEPSHDCFSLPSLDSQRTDAISYPTCYL